MSIKVYPYKAGSRSAKALAQALGVLRVRLTGSQLTPNRHTFVNWGNPRLPYRLPREWLNRPQAVGQCSNKHLFFRMMDQEGLADHIPTWTTDKEHALTWGTPVIARTHLRASGGRGAYYLTHEELQDTDSRNLLYTKYFKKMEEYRVHYGPLGIFHVQQKRKRHGEEADYKIRNHEAGWVFTIGNVSPPAAVLDVCRRVMAACPLDFGALDILYNQHRDCAKVCEVNTAPGLEGTTLAKYVEMIQEVTN